MQTSLPNYGQPTSGCGDSRHVQPFPHDGESRDTTSRCPIFQLACERSSQDTSMNASDCGTLQHSNGHFRKHQQLSLVPSFDYQKGIDHYPTLRPTEGNIKFPEKTERNVESPKSFGLVLPDGQNPRRLKNGAKGILDVTCETWFGVILVLCLMAVVGFVHLRIRIMVLEEQNIELEHIKSKMNILEQLVNRMNEANSKHRIKNTLETPTDAPISMKFPKEPQLLPVFTGTTNQPASRGGGLSRAKRDASEQRNAPVKGVMRSILNCYCKTKSGKGTSRQTTGQLEFVQFLAVFNGSPLDQHISTMTPEFNGDPNAVEIEGDWPYILRIGGVITYIRQGSPLHIYEAYKPQPVDNSTVLVENSNVSSTFTVKISGLYAVHVDITISDENHRNKQYIGVYVNGLVVLGCLNGGLWSSENLKDSPVTRICNINGVLNLKESDRIQLKTMEAHITILVDPKKFNSVFTMVLLHKSSTSGAEAGRGYICPWAPD